MTIFFKPNVSFVFVLRFVVMILTVWVTQFKLNANATDVNWKELNLSPQQSSQINSLELNWEKNHQRLTHEIHQDQTAIKQLLLTGDREKIQTLQRRIMKNKMDLMNQSTETFMKKREQLNPDQQLRLQKILPR
jgi:hypothetical protein